MAKVPDDRRFAFHIDSWPKVRALCPFMVARR